MSNDKHASSAEEVLREHETTITTALGVYQERMNDAAREAQASYETLAADPRRRAAHDASHPLITTDGYRISAQMFRDAADRAHAARQAITNHLSPDPDDGDQS